MVNIAYCCQRPTQ